MDQDFTLLFDDETSSRLLQKWDTFFKPNIIKEAKQLASTPELNQLLLSAESPQGSDIDEKSKLYLICKYNFFLVIIKSLKSANSTKYDIVNVLNSTMTCSYSNVLHLKLIVNSCDFLFLVYDQEMASLLLLIHLLPPPPGGPKSPKISACDAAGRLVMFHKVLVT